MATVKKYQKGGMVSTVKKAASKIADKVNTAVKTAAPKESPFKDLGKTRIQKFKEIGSGIQKNGGKTAKKAAKKK